MSWAVVRKTVRDYLALTLVLMASVVLFEVLVVRILLEAAKDLELVREWLDRSLIKVFIQLALGADLMGDLTPTTLSTLGLAHPLLYILCWTLVLTIATGVLAGEIGRGTADLLLTLPVSRGAVYVSTTVVWWLALIPVSFAPLLGLWLGERAFPLSEPLDFSRLWRVSVNFLALNWSVAGLTMCVSSFVSRRGTAVAVAMAVLVVSDLINLLVPFWKAVEPYAFLGFLHYFKPLVVLRSGQLPWGNMTVLLGVAVVTWLIGYRRFTRRDIPSV